MNGELHRALASMAATRVLLVASDFDGTLAPIVNDPDCAHALPESNEALRELSRLARTHVAIISGRGLADLAARTRVGEPIWLIGSYGAEIRDTAPTLTDHVQLERIVAALEKIAGVYEGLRVERKPSSAALHYRQATAADSAAARDHAITLAKDLGVCVHEGDRVVELCLTSACKSDALAHVRASVGATGVVYIGDDASDEEAIVTLGASDLGIRVGAGISAANWRVGGVQDVRELLMQLLELRREWLSRVRRG